MVLAVLGLRFQDTGALTVMLIGVAVLFMLWYCWGVALL